MKDSMAAIMAGSPASHNAVVQCPILCNPIQDTQEVACVILIQGAMYKWREVKKNRKALNPKTAGGVVVKMV